MYTNGQPLNHDQQFKDHIEHEVPVQVYFKNNHKDIGFVEYYTTSFIKVNNIYYNRAIYTFISRPGY